MLITQALLDNPANTMQELDVSRCSLDLSDLECSSLFEYLKTSPTLQTLNMRDNLVRDEAALGLLDAMKSNPCLRLALDLNPVKYALLVQLEELNKEHKV